MCAWYLGYCHRCPDGSRIGKIQPLRRLRLEGGRFVTDESCDFSEFGPSRMIFWPPNPPPSHDLTGCLVRVLCKPTYQYGEENTEKDWMMVALSDSGWECELAGHRVVEVGTEAEWRQEPRWVAGFSEGERVFILQISDATLIGPWRVGGQLEGRSNQRELDPIAVGRRVYRYAIDKLDRLNILEEEVHDKGLSKKLFVLLDPPDEHLGEPVDLFTPRQLAKWLVKQINRLAPELLRRLDKESPGWRGRIREEVEGYSDPEQTLFRLRWERLDAILENLSLDAEQIDRLLEHVKFHERFDAAVATRVHDAVLERAEKIETEAANLASARRTLLGGEIAELESQRSNLESEVARLEALRSQQDQREHRLREMTEHLAESRNRLILDAAALQPFFGPNVNKLPRSNGPIADCGVSRPGAHVSTQTFDGSPVTSPVEFVDSRLWPALHAWLPGTPRSMAALLHSALAGSRATLVPNPAWAKAYAESFGGPAQLTIVNVEPTWLGFADLWRGGFGKCWDRAFQSPNLIELVLLRDFNRALPQCYARPLLDLLAGFTAELPAPGRGGWPPNLRLVACPAPQSEALPLTSEVVQHFAAIQKVPAASADKLPPDIEAGYLPADTWLRWSIHPNAPTPHGDWAKEYGPLARSASIEVATVARVLQQIGWREREAVKDATDIRAIDAAEYVGQSDATAGISQ
jgi:hypothetical protein